MELAIGRYKKKRAALRLLFKKPLRNPSGNGKVFEPIINQTLRTTYFLNTNVLHVKHGQVIVTLLAVSSYFAPAS